LRRHFDASIGERGEDQVGDALAHLDIPRGDGSWRAGGEAAVVRRTDLNRPRDPLVRRDVVVKQ
jgi:hypothetical protein